MQPKTRNLKYQAEYIPKELMEIAIITEGQKISYVADSSIDEENIRKIIILVKDSDTLYCEAYFLEEDRERAIERHHLTAKTAGMIAERQALKTLLSCTFLRNTGNAPTRLKRSDDGI